MPKWVSTRGSKGDVLESRGWKKSVALMISALIGKFRRISQRCVMLPWKRFH